MFSKTSFAVLVAICAFISFLCIRRMYREAKTDKEKPMGCLGFGAILVVLVITTVVTYFVPFAYYDKATTYSEHMKGAEKIRAEVIDAVAEDYTYSRDGKTYRATRYYPVYQFTTAAGVAVIDTAVGTDIGRTEIGEIRTIYYNPDARNTILTIDVATWVFIFGLPFLFIPFVAMFFGFLYFSVGGEMKWYYTFCTKMFFIVYVPAAMIAGYAMIVYLLFYGTISPGVKGMVAKGILILFIVTLPIGIYAYIKALLNKKNRAEIKYG